ncbi:carbohydrate ABC transporter permease [Mycetocola saprophilus]|uniref:carbohydrate ABC transporter permease n=1 Tax=Mycetocola saprophilus TaxID=76636 RepID=UPI0004BF644E|nr:sugar ABC transporter permease [Mycetocola saprophilus]
MSTHTHTVTPAPAARAASRRRGNPQRSTQAAPWLLIGPFLALFILTFALPILMAIVSSFQRVERRGLFGEEGVSTVFAGFNNYAQALGDANFITSIGRMILFGIVQVPVMIALCTLLALLLESASARWPGVFRAAFFLPYGIPGVIATILWSFLYTPGLSPLIDAAKIVGIEVDPLGSGMVLWSIANIVTWTYTGYNMLIVIAQLKSIPGDIYEAAKLDGAGPVRIARSIQLPLIRPALMLTTVFSIIGTLQLFAEPQVLATSSTAIDSGYTPNLAAYTNAFAYNNYNVAAAQAVLIALIAFALSFTFLRLSNRGSK